jgi:prepilin-type N-terminal cleavage/methylation domain-containing protein
LTASVLFSGEYATPVDGSSPHPSAAPGRSSGKNWHEPGTRPPRKRNMERRGFTLIELLVALLVAAILAAGAAELISLSLVLKRKADAHAVAARLVVEKLEELRTRPFDGEALRAESHEETVPAANGDAELVRQWKVEDASARIKRISVSVRSRGRTVAQTTLLVSRDLGFGP